MVRVLRVCFQRQPGYWLLAGAFQRLLAKLCGNGILYNVRIGIPIVSFFVPTTYHRVDGMFCKKNETIESKLATLEQSALPWFWPLSSSQYPGCLLNKQRSQNSVVTPRSLAKLRRTIRSIRGTLASRLLIKNFPSLRSNYLNVSQLSSPRALQPTANLLKSAHSGSVSVTQCKRMM